MADLHPFRDLYDAAIRHSALRLTCPRCRHSVTLSVAGLWRHFNRRGWNDRFEHVRARLVCRPCLARDGTRQRPRLDFCDDPPTDNRFPLPSTQEWKFEARRRR